MATLLAVLTTDAVSEPGTLRSFWKHVVDRTFNAISVDGDTSTNDTVLLLANGHAGIDPSRDGATWKLFEEAVTDVARALALAIVEDGEGATKRLEIQIVGAQTEAHAREVGRAIARSTLVKTAIYGGDPNWGRVLAAAGVAGVALVAERITLDAQSANGWLTLATGGATALADPATARAIFEQKAIRLRLDLGLGRSEAVVWTCDLSPDYVRINSGYPSLVTASSSCRAERGQPRPVSPCGPSGAPCAWSSTYPPAARRSSSASPVRQPAAAWAAAQPGSKTGLRGETLKARV